MEMKYRTQRLEDRAAENLLARWTNAVDDRDIDLVRDNYLMQNDELDHSYTPDELATWKLFTGMA
jgi:hypothetical protein